MLCFTLLYVVALCIKMRYVILCIKRLLIDWLIVVKSRLMDHLTFNRLLNSHQSAYCQHHSTETALLYIHDHLVSAIGSQKVSCLCLLDLSAAFDTIDHNSTCKRVLDLLIITRLSSWFGIHGSVLSWFKSYLLSRCFRVKCKTGVSSWHTSSSGVAPCGLGAV